MPENKIEIFFSEVPESLKENIKSHFSSLSFFEKDFSEFLNSKKHRLVVFSKDSKQMRDILLSGVSCIEINDENGFAVLKDNLLNVYSSGCIISVSTKTAISMALEKIAIEHLKNLCSGKVIEKASTALCEALSNAIIHGNLEINHGFTTAENLERHYEKIYRALKKEENASKQVTVVIKKQNEEVSFTIKDSGQGYDYKSISNHTGRGVKIIKEMADEIKFSDGGSQISATFKTMGDKKQKIDFEKKIISQKIKNSDILIVDDSELSRLVIFEILKSAGFSQIRQAEDSKQAQELIAKRKPDLIFLDIEMPDKNGIDFAKELLAVPKNKSISIIMVTGTSSVEEKARAFTSGACDLIAKPISSYELASRAFLHLENATLLQDLTNYKTRIEAELEQAIKSQNSIMPSEDRIKNLKENFQLDVAAIYKPAAHLGGDFWGFIPISDEKIGVFIADFSGHGITSSLNTFAINALINERKFEAEDPALFLSEINKVLTPVLPNGLFATMFYGVIDNKNNLITYSPASSAPVAIIDHKNKKIEKLEVAGFPIGVTKNAVYENHRMSFNRDSALLMFSDVFIESEDEAGNFLSQNDLYNKALENLKNGAEATVNNLISLFYSHAGEKLRDDLTVNLYYRLP